MGTECRLGREGAEDVAIVDPERPSMEQVLDVSDAARRLEDFRSFMAEDEFSATILRLRKRPRVLFRAPVGINHEALDAGSDEVVESVSDQRAIRDGDERLGAMLRETFESRAKASPENERL